MRANKRRALAEKGWRTGSAGDFLDLDDAELAIIDLKLSLARALKAFRQKKLVTQCDLAAAIASSQSRVAKMEAGDPGVSLDLLLKSMLSLGATRRDIANSLTQFKNARRLAKMGGTEPDLKVAERRRSNPT